MFLRFLGGANAFHFLSFVSGLVTLVINVNNNVNSNNNNLNGNNVNANSQSNLNGNANNNAANSIVVMPGRKKREAPTGTSASPTFPDARDLRGEVGKFALEMMELMRVRGPRLRPGRTIA